MEKKEDLIERYIHGKLTEEELPAFEKALEQSAALRQELARNRYLIEGLQNVRKQELKAMLNKVAISTHWGQKAIQAGLALVSVSLVGVVLYFSVREKNDQPLSVTNRAEEVSAVHQHRDTPPYDAENQDQAAELNSVQTTPKSQTSPTSVVAKPIEKNSPAARTQATSVPTPPAPPEVSTDHIEVIGRSRLHPFPTAADERRSDASYIDPVTTHTPIEVVLNKAFDEYRFHYFFKDNRLMLYGPFSANLYELLEMDFDEPTLYLSYQKEYYAIQKGQTTMAPLARISDSVLIQKLDSIKGQ